jgi:hypothetical protein
VLDGLKSLIIRWLGGIESAKSQLNITVKEGTTKEVTVLKNKLWYRGDPVELEQFYKQLCEFGAEVSRAIPSARFWAASSDSVLVRKLHSGLPRMIADKLAAIVVNDMNEPEIDNAVKIRWEEFCEGTDFEELLKNAVVSTLSEGDGAFKLSVDPELSQLPLLEFHSGNNVEFKYKRGKLQEVQFLTDYWDDKNQHYKLVEHYGKGYVNYELLNDMGSAVDLSVIPELEDLKNVTFTGDYMMAVPFKIYTSAKWKDRGESVFEGKGEFFDAFDEVVSTWMDALRAGRVKQYIPESLIPRNEENGAILKPDVFNPYIVVNPGLMEDGEEKIQTEQGSVEYQGFLASYTTFLDCCLMGLISPSTLGIDVKKLDNAESQREKEKTTVYTRNDIIKALSKVLPKVVDAVLKTWDNMGNKAPGKYKSNFSWGEYADPSFESQVETIGKAKQYGIMSLERCIEELYGDTLTPEEKAKEIELIQKAQVVEMDEPSLEDDIEFAKKVTKGGDENAPNT